MAEVAFTAERQLNNISLRLINTETFQTITKEEVKELKIPKLEQILLLLTTAVEHEDAYNESEQSLPLRIQSISTFHHFRLLYLLKDLPKKFLHNLDVLSAKAYLDINENNPLDFTLSIQKDETYIIGEDTVLIGEEEFWAIQGEEEIKLFHVDITHPQAITHIQKKTATPVSPILIKQFLSNAFYSDPKMGRVRVDQLPIREVELPLTPRIYLHDQQPTYTIELRFGYGSHTFSNEQHSYVYENNMLLYIKRDRSEERSYSAILSHFATEQDGVFVPKGDPLNWLADSSEQLIKHGFEFYGRRELLQGAVTDEAISLSVSLSADMDWIDLKLEATCADNLIPPYVLLEAIKRKQRFVKLSDEQVGVIPLEWIDKLSHLLGFVDPNKLRIPKSQMLVANELVSIATRVNEEEQFKILKEKFASFESIPEYEVTKTFTGTLREYQQAGYNWLMFLKEFGLGGILADDMGLGKTCQVLALLATHMDENPTKPSLIVVPTSLIHNWVAEAKKFTPDLHFTIHHGANRAKQPHEVQGLIITTYTTMRNDERLFTQVPFSYVILDESQNIKNPSSQIAKTAYQLHADHRLAMTGTPIENSSLELWSQFCFAQPGMLGDEAYFRKEFAKKIEERNDVQAQRTLRKMIKPFIMRRTKEMVAKDLPPKQIMTVLCDMEEEQERIYSSVKAWVREEVEQADIGENTGLPVKVLQGLLRLRQIANHPKLFDPAYMGVSGKCETMINHIVEVVGEGHKVLVFSTFLGILDLLRARLELHNITSLTLTGKTKERQELVDAFQNEEDKKVFLISLKAGGVGLTLTAADYVFIADPWWNPAIEMQAIDRAHRIGQTRSVFVYKMISAQSVEEKILRLQEAKTKLLESVISEEEGFAKNLTSEDLQYLLS